MTGKQYNWSRKSLEELEDMYYTEIRPVMVRDGYEPDDGRPSYSWLADNGFSGLAYALREHHDLTLKEFFVEEVGLGDDTPGEDGESTGEEAGGDDYEWELRNDDVIEEIQRHIRRYQMGEPIADTTARTRRSRLASYARVYEQVHGGRSLLDALDDIHNQPQERQRCLEAFNVLGQQLSTVQSKLKSLSDVQKFYAKLMEYTHAEYNPTTNLKDELGWSHKQTDNETVSREQMQAIYAEADDIADRMVVLGLGAWGLRPVEVASAHVSQFRLTDDDPHIDFEDRKNGPGQVSLLFGVETLYQRIEDLDEPGWSGYLFPSPESASGHRTRATINNRFKRLAEDAGVLVDGETPTAKYGRRFWYTIYKDAVDRLADQLEGVAEDQGSSSVGVVMSNYISEEELRQYRREAMRDELAAVFGDER